jgi:phosphatidylglycerol:prolipoprotein diacylglycerol transferase
VLPDFDVLGLSVKTFGLAFGLSFVLCGMVLARRLRETDRRPDWAYEMIFAALVGGLVGARGWWALDHLKEIGDDPLGNLFGGSGLVWYGGALGGAVGVLLWAWRKGMLDLLLLDLCAPALALGYASGRIGCQVAGDGDYGKPWDGPWAMAYPKGVVPTDVKVHPTPIYESLSMGIAAIVLWRLRDRFAPGRLFALYLVLAGVERFLVEFLRRNPDSALGLTTAQLFSAVMVIVGGVWLAVTRRTPSARTEGPRPAARRRAAPSGGGRPA